MDALSERGIKDVMAIEDILPLENDPRTGGPLYERPATKVALAPVNRSSPHNLH